MDCICDDSSGSSGRTPSPQRRVPQRPGPLATSTPIRTPDRGQRIRPLATSTPLSPRRPQVPPRPIQQGPQRPGTCPEPCQRGQVSPRRGQPQAAPQRGLVPARQQGPQRQPPPARGLVPPRAARPVSPPPQRPARGLVPPRAAPPVPPLPQRPARGLVPPRPQRGLIPQDELEGQGRGEPNLNLTYAVNEESGEAESYHEADCSCSDCYGDFSSFGIMDATYTVGPQRQPPPARGVVPPRAAQPAPPPLPQRPARGLVPPRQRAPVAQRGFQVDDEGQGRGEPNLNLTYVVNEESGESGSYHEADCSCSDCYGDFSSLEIMDATYTVGPQRQPPPARGLVPPRAAQPAPPPLPQRPARGLVPPRQRAPVAQRGLIPQDELEGQGRAEPNLNLTYAVNEESGESGSYHEADCSCSDCYGDFSSFGIMDATYTVGPQRQPPPARGLVPPRAAQPASPPLPQRPARGLVPPRQRAPVAQRAQVDDELVGQGRGEPNLNLTYVVNEEFTESETSGEAGGYHEADCSCCYCAGEDSSLGIMDATYTVGPQRQPSPARGLVPPRAARPASPPPQRPARGLVPPRAAPPVPPLPQRPARGLVPPRQRVPAAPTPPQAGPQRGLVPPRQAAPPPRGQTPPCAPCPGAGGQQTPPQGQRSVDRFNRSRVPARQRSLPAFADISNLAEVEELESLGLIPQVQLDDEPEDQGRREPQLNLNLTYVINAVSVEEFSTASETSGISGEAAGNHAADCSCCNCLGEDSSLGILNESQINAGLSPDASANLCICSTPEESGEFADDSGATNFQMTQPSFNLQFDQGPDVTQPNLDQTPELVLEALNTESQMDVYDPLLLNRTMAPRERSFTARRRLLFSSITEDLDEMDKKEQEKFNSLVESFQKRRRDSVMSRTC